MSILVILTCLLLPPPPSKPIGMFQEWRRHTTLAEAQRLYVIYSTLTTLTYEIYFRAEKEDDTRLKREQVAKLRAAVYTLQQKKELTQSDQLLLQKLSKRLRTLHNAPSG